MISQISINKNIQQIYRGYSVCYQASRLIRRRIQKPHRQPFCLCLIREVCLSLFGLWPVGVSPQGFCQCLFSPPLTGTQLDTHQCGTRGAGLQLGRAARRRVFSTDRRTNRRWVTRWSFYKPHKSVIIEFTLLLIWSTDAWTSGPHATSTWGQWIRCST